MVPEILTSFADEMAPHDRVDISAPWHSHGPGTWSLPLVVRLSVPPSEAVPLETSWHLVVEGSSFEVDVGIYPDGKNGLTATFPHQSHNDKPEKDKPWRTGNPCVERPIANLGRVAWNDEPQSDLQARMRWKVERLLHWVDAAAEGRLVQTGDPFEVPAFPAGWVADMVAFNESKPDLAFWNASAVTWGFARMAAVPRAKRTLVLTEFMAGAGATIRKVDWSAPITDTQPDFMGIWIKLPTIPVLQPWQRPTTWRELNSLLEADGFDLAYILQYAGAAYRKSSSKARHYRLLLGFPVAERIGDTPDRLHWLAIHTVPLCSRKTPREGFRTTEDNHLRWDRELASSTKSLVWQRTSNWASDQMRMRGEAEDMVRRKKVLLIGCGTLGAAVAENLLRMGVTNMGLMDSDVFQHGNLSRHVLTMEDIGHAKSIALAARLNSAMPDARVEALTDRFPPAKANMANRLRGYDVIVDCTAEDAVLHAMGQFEWGNEKQFVVLSITWRAEGLLAYAASEAAFPTYDATAKFGAAPTPPVNFDEARAEGVGCWNPVFPATADDVQLWAALGSKFVRRAIISGERSCTYFRQTNLGTVERVDV
ncbi:ThiF family adenylyltransferase [Xylophilus sp. Leaf220]|uniref:HesA/MoeB/ThiF family protein n=1 Tax=Xylophilus sp. Leaf220 TaxID=1735686 RepID=UPI0006F2EFD1|nr:ThiF family adenylyltransferase [Xylophilus sp. Leaf220]KQM79642.1 hypothetical protein ASE76_00010 [Xylophilus sp. Leaf220]